MQEKHVFEHAVIRVVPRVEREEFLNIGVILYCRQQKFLEMMYLVDEERLSVFEGCLDCGELNDQLAAFVEICSGSKAGGPIGELDMASRFRWLTASRSTVVQTSRVHPGLSSNARETLGKLYRDLVL